METSVEETHAEWGGFSGGRDGDGRERGREREGRMRRKRISGRKRGEEEQEGRKEGIIMHRLHCSAQSGDTGRGKAREEETTV